MPRQTKQQRIEELERKLNDAYLLLQEAENREAAMQENADALFKDSAIKKQLEKDLAFYKQMYKAEHERCEHLKEQLQTMRKRLPAGRKPHDERWTNQYQKFIEMHESGMSQKEIMQKLEISRATYFRYKKISNLHNNSSE